MSKLKQKGDRWNIVISNKLNDRTIDWINSKGGSAIKIFSIIEQLLDSNILQVDYESATEKYSAAIDKGESITFARERINFFYRYGLIDPCLSKYINCEESYHTKYEDQPEKMISSIKTENHYETEEERKIRKNKEFSERIKNRKYKKKQI